MKSVCALVISRSCSNEARIGSGTSFKNSSKLDGCLVIGRSSKGDLGLGCTSQSTAECNARLFQRGRV